MKRLIVASFCLTGIIGLAPAIPGVPGLAAQDRPTQAAAKPTAPNGKRVAKLGEVPHSGFENGKPRTFNTPHPATQDPTRLVTTADLTAWSKKMMADNWGRWGPNDTKGALNLITPAKTLEAAKLVREGITVPLGSFLGLNDFKYEIDTFRRVAGRHWQTERDWMGNPLPSSAVAFGTHDGTVSHMDAMCHYPGSKVDPSRGGRPGEEEVTYNGYPFIMSAETGCPKMGIDEMGLQYATRGVLYDMVYLKGGPDADWNDPTLPIFIEDLEEWERFTGAKVGKGDAMIVRNGRYALRAKEGAWNYDRGNGGLHASVLPWIHARDIAVLIGDGPNDVQPSGVQGIGRPVHQMMMTVMGRPIVDNGFPEEAARVAKQLKRWEFMVSWRNLDIPGGSASPFNAVAIF
jgi:hypothetical protein